MKKYLTNLFDSKPVDSKSVDSKSVDSESQRFLMLSADEPLCEFEMSNADDDAPVSVIVKLGKIYNDAFLARLLHSNLSNNRFYMFIERRMAYKRRKNMGTVIFILGLDLYSYIEQYHGLSLTDTIWFKKIDEKLSWDDVSMYKNPFNSGLSKYLLDGRDLENIRLEGLTPEFSTGGTNPKCWVHDDKGIWLLKGGRPGNTNYLREPYMEYYAYQVALAMGIPAVGYDVLKSDSSPFSKCKLFTSVQTGFLSAFDAIGSTSDVMSSLLKIYSSLGATERFYEMLVFDSIICNPERYLSNFGFFIDNKTFEITGVAPIFDHGVSLGSVYSAPVGAGVSFSSAYSATFNADSFEKYLDAANRGSSILHFGLGSFIDVGREAIKRIDPHKVRALLDFEFDSKPGFEVPGLSLDLMSQLVRHQVKEILR